MKLDRIVQLHCQIENLRIAIRQTLLFLDDYQKETLPDGAVAGLMKAAREIEKIIDGTFDLAREEMVRIGIPLEFRTNSDLNLWMDVYCSALNAEFTYDQESFEFQIVKNSKETKIICL